MKMQSFDAEKHLATLNEWLRERGHPDSKVEQIPAVGFVATAPSNTLACMGFLRKCEGKLVIVDGISTNPVLSSQERHESIHAVWECMRSWMLENDFRLVLILSSEPSIVDRAKDLGFTYQGLQVLSKELL